MLASPQSVMILKFMTLSESYPVSLVLMRVLRELTEQRALALKENNERIPVLGAPQPMLGAGFALSFGERRSISDKPGDFMWVSVSSLLLRRATMHFLRGGSQPEAQGCIPLASLICPGPFKKARKGSAGDGKNGGAPGRCIWLTIQNRVGGVLGSALKELLAFPDSFSSPLWRGEPVSPTLSGTCFI